MTKFLMVGLMAAVAVPALAQVAPTAPVRPMADGVMTRAEVTTMVRDHFTKIDANRDGFVTAEEMQAMRGQHMKMMGQRMGGHDGKAGGMGNGMAMFDRLDANKDGKISRDEFAKAREMRGERMAQRGGAHGAMGAGGHGKMMGHGGMGGHMLKMADANNDGRITLQEATAKALEHFDKMDANRDGQVTRDERHKMREQMKAMHAPKAS